MAYIAVRFDTGADDVDAWSDALLAAGALSVDASDPRAGTDDEAPLFGEPGEPGGAWWPTSRLSALFAADADVDAALSDASTAVARALPPCERYAVAEQDWVRATQAQFGPIEVAAGFWIVPSWCAVPPSATCALTLDPGLAFGTGSHPTTRLCLEWLHAHVRAGDSLLDYGCGSGILAIAAARLGAARVVGTDVDPQAMVASAANARANCVAAAFVAPDLLEPGTYDIVIANILANPLVLLAPALSARVRTGGRIALSGILASQASDVAAAYARWFTLAVGRGCDGWVLLDGVRTENR